MVLTGLAAGAISGAILLFLSHVAPAVGAGNFIRDTDRPHLFGKALSRREAHLLGILFHASLSTVFGGAYAYLVGLGLFADFGILSIMGWGLILSVFMGGVVLPLEGHGVFGVKEDAWFPVDLFLTNLGWAVLFWFIIRIWLPVT